MDRDERKWDDMRILHVIDSLGSGGTETSLQELLPRLQDGDLSHIVTTFNPRDEAPSNFRDAGIQVITPPDPLEGRLARLRHVIRTVRSNRPDLLHTSLFEADLAGRVAGRITRTPVLTSLVNTSYVPAAWPGGLLARSRFRIAKGIDGLLGRHATHAFHAVTQAVADQAVVDLGLDPGRIWVVPRGRSLERLGEPSAERRDTLRTAFGISPGEDLLLNVGRHEPQKGQRELIAAVKLVRDRNVNATLFIAGREGRSTGELLQEIAHSGLEDAVRLLGARDDIGDLLAAADLFVFPSHYEGIGGAMLEAMLMKVPVVVSDLPGLREVLDGERCGVLVPVGDPEALAGAICAGLQDRAAAAVRAEAASQRIHAFYTLEASVEGMRQLYSLLQGELTSPPEH